MACKLLSLVCVLWIYLYIPATEALWCYQCSSVKTDMPCITDYKGMKKSAITMKGKYAKDCSNQFLDQKNSTEYYCLIETHFLEGGNLLSFHRECTDGVHFSYNIDLKKENITQLENLKPNNHSTCVYFANNVICLRLCNKDFCNGPVTNKTDGIVGNILLAPFVMCVLLSLVLY